VQPDSKEALDDRKISLYCLVKKRKQFHSSSYVGVPFKTVDTLGDKNESSVNVYNMKVIHVILCNTCLSKMLGFMD
jgi:hypothetical protein